MSRYVQEGSKDFIQTSAFPHTRHIIKFCRRHQHSTGRSEQVLLFENQTLKPRYFLAIGIVSGIQLVLWSYLSYFALTQLGAEKKCNSDDTCTKNGGKRDKQSHSWALSLKWRAFFSTLALGTGIFFATTACLYPLRMVHKLYFLPSTNAIQLLTYTPLGTMRSVEVPLTRVFCNGSRTSNRTHVALKAQGYPMYFLVDRTQGQFPVPRTFDVLVGSRRRM